MLANYIADFGRERFFRAGRYDIVQIGVREIAFLEVDTAHVRAAEICVLHRRVVEIRAGQIGLAEISLCQIASGKVRARQFYLVERRFSEICKAQ